MAAVTIPVLWAPVPQQFGEMLEPLVGIRRAGEWLEALNSSAIGELIWFSLILSTWNEEWIFEDSLFQNDHQPKTGQNQHLSCHPSCSKQTLKTYPESIALCASLNHTTLYWKAYILNLKPKVLQSCFIPPMVIIIPVKNWWCLKYCQTSSFFFEIYIGCSVNLPKSDLHDPPLLIVESPHIFFLFFSGKNHTWTIQLTKIHLWIFR